jgi:hypothetical protein
MMEKERLLERVEKRHFSAYLNARLAALELPPKAASTVAEAIYRIRVMTMYGAPGGQHYAWYGNHSNFEEMCLGRLKEVFKSDAWWVKEVAEYIRETERLLAVHDGNPLDLFMVEIMET